VRAEHVATACTSEHVPLRASPAIPVPTATTPDDERHDERTSERTSGASPECVTPYGSWTNVESYHVDGAADGKGGDGAGGDGAGGDETAPEWLREAEARLSG